MSVRLVAMVAVAEEFYLLVNTGHLGRFSNMRERGDSRNGVELPLQNILDALEEKLHEPGPSHCRVCMHT
jgi:hypothetical protein